MDLLILSGLCAIVGAVIVLAGRGFLQRRKNAKLDKIEKDQPADDAAQRKKALESYGNWVTRVEAISIVIVAVGVGAQTVDGLKQRSKEEQSMDSQKSAADAAKKPAPTPEQLAKLVEDSAASTRSLDQLTRQLRDMDGRLSAMSGQLTKLEERVRKLEAPKPVTGGGKGKGGDGGDGDPGKPKPGSPSPGNAAALPAETLDSLVQSVGNLQERVKTLEYESSVRALQVNAYPTPVPTR